MKGYANTPPAQEVRDIEDRLFRMLRKQDKIIKNSKEVKAARAAASLPSDPEPVPLPEVAKLDNPGKMDEVKVFDIRR